MKKNEYVLLLTGTINPDKNIPFLEVNDCKQRENQYINALKFYIVNCKVKNIVFCENSNTECPDEVTDLARKYNVNFEWLTFDGDAEKTVNCGKSYGESEIMDFAIKNSALILEKEYFVKSTGRLIIRNYNWITWCISTNKNYFITFGTDRIETLDTRAYAMKRCDYVDCFSNLYDRQLKAKTLSIEHMYPAAIYAKSMNCVTMPVRVNFVGVSGGYGLPYITSVKKEVFDSIGLLFKTKFGSCIFLENVSEWQSDMRITDAIWNSYFSELTGKKVVLCGAGMVGARFYSVFNEKCKIIGWSDKNYNTVKKIHKRKIESLESVARRKCDFFVVCVKSEDSYIAIANYIKKNNSSHVVWIKDLITNVEDYKYFV